MHIGRGILTCCLAVILTACVAAPPGKPTPTPMVKTKVEASGVAKDAPAKNLTAVEQARIKLADLTETETALTKVLIDERNRLLALPQDSPNTRNITRRLAIINKRAQTLASQVFAAQLGVDQAVEAAENARLDAAMKAAAAPTNSATASTNAPPLPTAATNAPLQLRRHRLTSSGEGNSLFKTIWGFNLFPSATAPSANAQPRFIIGTLENVSTNKVINVTIAFTLLDVAGDSVGTASDAINLIEAGNRWQFKAPVLDQSAVQVELLEIKHGAPGGLPSLPGTTPPAPAPPPSP